MEGKGTLTIRSGQSENFAYFAIGDTGNGISEEEKTKIFKPFHSTKSQGVGLGLPTAKRIVVAHGGRIEVDTRLGQGTVFTVWLPYLEN
jgi:signal transduction histidine kinase